MQIRRIDKTHSRSSSRRCKTVISFSKCNRARSSTIDSEDSRLYKCTVPKRNLVFQTTRIVNPPALTELSVNAVIIATALLIHPLIESLARLLLQNRTKQSGRKSETRSPAATIANANQQRRQQQ